MKKTPLLALAALLILPSAASAAIADADVRGRGLPRGPVTFTAAKGERNKVTITATGAGLVFRDRANRVVAKGDCVRVDRHAARCPFSEDGGVVRLGNRDDRAQMDTDRLSFVSGGSGDDVLRGSVGRQVFLGDGGKDELHGSGGNDELTGGTGRDKLFGGSGDDTLFDGETDRQAAADLFRGGSSRDSRGPDRGDTIDYSKRKRALDIDLSRGKVNFGGEGDVIRGLESVRGGSGNDKLSGDGDDNVLEGQGGNDRVRGRGGDDIPRGGTGDDRVSGDDGNDVVWGDRGTDRLFGGNGEDGMIARDSKVETVDCGDGYDTASVTRLQTVVDCERAGSGSILVTVQPEVQGNTATFQVSCVGNNNGCNGTISLSNLDRTVDYGSGDYANVPHGADILNPVEVELTQEGKQAIQRGEIIQVIFPGAIGGYRAYMQRN